MRFELDHVFVTVPTGAPQMDDLLAAGFAEGAANEHPGQGTACRRLPFAGAYLELLWLLDPAAAAAPGPLLAGIGPRAGLQPGASRLGVGLRRADAAPGPLPVDTWEYRPPYLPDGAAIAVATSSHRTREPLIFFLPDILGRPAAPPAHPNGAGAITGVRCTLAAGEALSPELEWLRGCGCLSVAIGERELLRVELDHGARGRSLSLLPDAPLLLTW